MTKRAFSRAMAIALFVILGIDAKAQDNQRAVFNLIGKHAGQFSSKVDRLEKVNPDAKALVTLLVKDITALQKALEGKSPPKEYFASLWVDAEVLSRINLDKPVAKDGRRLRTVVADLNLKLYNIRTSKKMPFALTWAAGVPKKPVGKAEVFESLKANLGEVGKNIRRFSDVDKKASELLKQAQRDVASLENKSADYKLSSMYLLSLGYDSQLFALAANRKTPPVVASAYFHSGVRDIQIKVHSAQKKRKSPFDDVKTNVATIDPNNNKPAGGYEVWYSPEGLVNNPIFHKRFQKFSTPTTKDLPSGDYCMWTQKKGRRGPLDEIDVVDNGKGECPVDLWIP
jgi:hypothetical protein